MGQGSPISEYREALIQLAQEWLIAATRAEPPPTVPSQKPTPLGWGIQRRSQPVEAKLEKSGFSQNLARGSPGEQAIKNFLRAISKHKT